MNIIGCLDVPTRGQFFLDGIDVRTLDEAASRDPQPQDRLLFQSFNLIPRTTAQANVELPLLYSGAPGRERARAADALEAVGLADRVSHYPNEMSGGQQQRVALARAIAIARRSCSRTNRRAISTDDEQRDHALFSRLNAGGRTIVVITHEEEIASFAKRTVRLRDGLVVEDRRRVPVETRPPRLFGEPAEVTEVAGECSTEG